MMANTAQDQEKTADSNAVSEEVYSSKNENGKVIEEEKIDDKKVDGEDYDDEDIEDEEEEEDEEGEERELQRKAEKVLDDDQDRRNPQYIPKGGAFYEHDNRTSLEDVENKDPQEVEKKKKIWKESKESERWLHDWYKESEQQPKTKAEIIETYGYDIRNEEAPPRARRRRKYGRGPDKYERNWEDEQAYMVKQNGPRRCGGGGGGVGGGGGRKKSFGKNEFPPLPSRKNDSSVEKPRTKSPSWKKPEEESVRRNKSPKMNNSYEKQGGGTGQINKNDQRSNLSGFSNKKSPNHNSKKMNGDDIKPFKNDKTTFKNSSFRRENSDVSDITKAANLKSGKQGDSPRNLDSNRNSPGDLDVAHLAEGFHQMTFHNKHSGIRDNRQNSNEMSESELDSPPNRLNPKRYSKNRKGFTAFFPPEEIVEIDPAEIKQLHQEQQKNHHVNLQQQPLNIQSVIRRFPPTYNGNPGYMAPRPIITGIPQQGMSPQGLQQALSPQGIPPQALSPQVPGLQTIELPPQPNFVPPMYIDMDPHYPPSDMLAPYPGYPSYSANQPGEIYQPSGGITYYNPDCQNTNQIRPPPARRQKAAIPILPPPE